MDINIQDKHYNKYLKYKTKYLELKQDGGFSWLNPFKSKPAPTAPTAPIAPIAPTAPIAPIAPIVHINPIEDALNNIFNIDKDEKFNNVKLTRMGDYIKYNLIDHLRNYYDNLLRKKYLIKNNLNLTDYVDKQFYDEKEIVSWTFIDLQQEIIKADIHLFINKEIHTIKLIINKIIGHVQNIINSKTLRIMKGETFPPTPPEIISLSLKVLQIFDNYLKYIQMK